MFAIAFHDRAAAAPAVTDLRSSGYEVELHAQPRDRIVIVAWPSRPDNLDVGAALELVRQVADDHGGDFLGHGGLVSFGLGG